MTPAPQRLRKGTIPTIAESARVLEHLRELVAIDSTNPPRRSAAIVERIERTLRAARGFDVRSFDLGAGSVAVLATRGTPRVVFNVHLDTVPVVPGWKREPFVVSVEGDRAYGLGACDAKGAAAALLAAALDSDAPVALLFTTDEEAGDARCARWFIAEPRGFEAVVVGEPTMNQAVVAHRGVGSARIAFRGDAGHASRGGGTSANHALVEWAGRALAFAEARRRSGLDVRLNIGRIEGGEKPNVIAGHAEVRFGVRPPPGASPADVLGALLELAEGAAEKHVTFVGESLPSRMHRGEAARRIATAWGVPVGEPVDFWTEAAIFSEVMPAIVYGPGSIGEAHSADEFVTLASLVRAAADYRRAFTAFATDDGRVLGAPDP
ncbi:MAG: acetylornithine deacetylase [Polyangiaceae bacterium]